MTPSLPLLHVAQSVVQATVVDVPILAVGVLLLILALALIWAPRRPATITLHRRDLRHGARGIIAGLAVLAVLPSVVPYDHLLVEAHDGHEEVHTAHCHGTSPGSCADAPIPSGPGQMLANEPLLAVPAMLSLLLLVTVVPLAGVTRRPELRPPLRVPAI